MGDPMLAALLLASLQSAPPAAGRFELTAVRTTTPPVIDGIVHEEEWRGAARAEGFIQYEPRRGEPSVVRTVVLVLYDSQALYVAFLNDDPEPPTAQLTQRDVDLFNDDAVLLVLDSYYDRRTAYFFMTNVLGTQTDGRLAEDGRSIDASWDATWYSAARRVPEGWTAELAIPLASIRYAAGEQQTWGINFGRSRRRSLEVSFWAGPLEQRTRVSQAGRLVGLNVPPAARRHDLIPYALARVQQRERPHWDIGLDARYALTPRLSLQGTVHPDFATIEADQEEVNLTRFELLLREKRPFFLEGQELFAQRIRTFYSRRIADLAAGGKLLGKQGPWTLALIGAASERFDSGSRASYLVSRTQRDILGSSNVALTLADRLLEGRHEGSASIDATLFFTRTLGMTAQLAKSYGRYGRGSLAYFLRPAYDSPTAHFHVRYTHLGDRFADNANVLGFIQDDDRRELDSALHRTWWPKAGRIERLEYVSNYNLYWSQAGTLRSWEVVERIDVELRNRWSLGGNYFGEFKRFERDFRNDHAGLSLGYNTRAYQSVRVGVAAGRNFGAAFRLTTAAARYKVTEALSTEYELQHLVLDPDPSGQSTWIHVLRANQAFTKDMFVRVFFQTNSAIDRRNVQAVFVYRYLPPFGTIQVAYQRGTAAFGQRSEQGHTLFVKTTTVF
jgi:hypothetical protein